MTSTLSADMVRDGLTPLLTRAGRPQSLTSEETLEVIRSADIAVALLEGRWNLIQESIDKGTELSRLVDMLQDFSTLIDRCTSTLDDVRAQPAQAVRLQSAVEKLKKLGTTATKTKQLLEKPLPPIDIDSLPANRHEQNPAGYIGLAELAEKLRSRGGD